MIPSDIAERNPAPDCASCMARALVERLGAAITFPQARDRLVCSSCDARNGAEGRIRARPSVVDYYDGLREKGMGMAR